MINKKPKAKNQPKKDVKPKAKNQPKKNSPRKKKGRKEGSEEESDLIDLIPDGEPVEEPAKRPRKIPSPANPEQAETPSQRVPQASVNPALPAPSQRVPQASVNPALPGLSQPCTSCPRPNGCTSPNGGCFSSRLPLHYDGAHMEGGPHPAWSSAFDSPDCNDADPSGWIASGSGSRAPTVSQLECQRDGCRVTGTGGLYAPRF